MAYSTYVKNFRNGSLVISDLADAHSLTVGYELGDFNIDPPKTDIVLGKVRGQITDPPILGLGEDQPQTGGWSCFMRDLSDASYITLEEILFDAGYYNSTWVSTLGAGNPVKTVKMVWTAQGTVFGDSANHTITMKYVNITGSLSEDTLNKLAIKFINYEAKPTLT